MNRAEDVGSEHDECLEVQDHFPDLEKSETDSSSEEIHMSAELECELFGEASDDDTESVDINLNDIEDN